MARAVSPTWRSSSVPSGCTMAAVQTAMNSKGRTDVVCIGVNGEAAAMDMIQKGEMQATIYQDGAGQVGKAIVLYNA